VDPTRAAACRAEDAVRVRVELFSGSTLELPLLKTAVV
jgi:hypothetical protein